MSLPRRRALLLPLAAGLMFAGSACGGDGGGSGENMSPGEDCLSCHSEFTLAGTVYAAGTSQGAAGVDVAVTDAAGVHHLTSNSVGNFFTTQPLSFPVDVSVSRGGQTSPMNGQPGSGACNSCHDASMRITVP